MRGGHSTILADHAERRRRLLKRRGKKREVLLAWPWPGHVISSDAK